MQGLPRPDELLLLYEWVAIVVCGLLYISDYLLTIWAARMHRAGAENHMAFGGGYELTPYYRETVARLRWFSWRFVLALAFLILVLCAVWLLTDLLGRMTHAAWIPAVFFPFVCGSWAILGGSIQCLVTAAQHRRLARKERQNAEM